jgi:hypothetical protein
MMERFRAAANPIYQHLTRHSKWPSVSEAAAMWFLLTAVGSSLTCVLPLLTGPRYPMPQQPVGIFAQQVMLAVMGASLFLLLVGPLITGAITGIATARAADPELLDLIRITQVPEETIVRGYLLAALFRLRWLWIAFFALALPLCIALILSLADRAHPLEAARTVMGTLESGSYFVVVAVIAGVALGSAAQWLTVCASLWAGLRFRHLGSAALASMGLAFASIIGMLIVLGLALFGAMNIAASAADDYIGAVVIFLIFVSCAVWIFYEVGQTFLSFIEFEQDTDE